MPRQREEGEEREDQDRHVADEADIGADQDARRPAAIDRGERREDADQRADDEPGEPHRQAEQQPRREVVEAAEHRAEVEHIVHGLSEGPAATSATGRSGRCDLAQLAREADLRRRRLDSPNHFLNEAA